MLESPSRTSAATPDAGPAWPIRILLRRSIGAAPKQHSGDRHDNDLCVEPDRLPIDVLQIELDASIERQIAPSRDLPEARDAGLDTESPALARRVLGHLHGKRRTRSHQAHVS